MDESNDSRTVADPRRTHLGTQRSPQPDKWRTRHALRLWLSDLLVLAMVIYGTKVLWLGLGDTGVSGLGKVSYWLFSAALAVVWLIALALSDTRSDRVLGFGNDEYLRVANASLRLFGLIAIVAFLFRIEVARGFLLISLPLGVIALVLERWLWRQWLVAKRSMGEYSARVLLVGSEDSVEQIASELQRATSAGYRVVGACVPTGRVGDTIGVAEIPIVGSVAGLEDALRSTSADTVAIISVDDLPPSRVKEISWSLEAGRQHLVLAPSLVDVAGPRIHMRPVAGLPLIHVETPRFSVGQLLLKRAFDVLAAALLLVLLSPLLLTLAVTIKTTSPGPAVYRHDRIGQDGHPFRVRKFRTMRVGADAELSVLLNAQDRADRPLFKIKDDPRITPVGRVLRKYSLDELPQLVNVLDGSMSLVGPRPQVAAEVALYTDAARRRLLARPGMTGLWQVNGRSALPWEDAVKLDLYYVENWSLLSDFAILAKTVKAVVFPGEEAH